MDLINAIGVTLMGAIISYLLRFLPDDPEPPGGESLGGRGAPTPGPQPGPADSGTETIQRDRLIVGDDVHTEWAAYQRELDRRRSLRRVITVLSRICLVAGSVLLIAAIVRRVKTD